MLSLENTEEKHANEYCTKRSALQSYLQKEDLKKYYQTMEIQDLADLVRDLNKWGSEGQGNFYDSESTGTQLLPSSWSIAYKALQDKTADRSAKGKNTFKEVVDSATQQ